MTILTNAPPISKAGQNDGDTVYRRSKGTERTEGSASAQPECPYSESEENNVRLVKRNDVLREAKLYMDQG